MNFNTLLSKLISFKTISTTSNKELMYFVKEYLSKSNIKCELLEGSKGQFNLYSRIGPNQDGGILFSGHTDVVPTEGQSWNSNPFKLIKKKNRFYGRGTCDMKSFIAVSLDLVSKININNLKKPIHLIFSYDEEIGCVGIQKIVPFIKKLNPKPMYCIVGEPTGMKVVNEHKGKKNFLVQFNGVEAHSSLIHNGVNSINFCTEFIEFLKDLQKSISTSSKNSKYNPPYSTINVGLIKGGIALNIIPKYCEIEFEIRDTPEINSDKILKKIKNYLKLLEKKMKKINKKCFITFKNTNDFPPLKTDEKKKIIQMALQKLKSNSINSVSFGTEAGVFNKLGLETIVCGPGNIEQAHKPNEYIEESQIIKCQNFLKNIIKYLY